MIAETQQQDNWMPHLAKAKNLCTIKKKKKDKLQNSKEYLIIMHLTRDFYPE